METYELTAKSLKLANRLIAEYDQHEAAEIEREANTCRACPYYLTCGYSIYNTSSAERKRHRARTDDP